MKLLEPLTIKSYTFKNRVVMPPMCMYSVFKQDGFLTDFHKAHYITRALGGVGYIIIESTGIVSEGRITPEDLGIWSDDHIKPFKELVDDLHEYGAIVTLQINHAGRKSRIMPGVSSSSIPFSDDYLPPKALEKHEIDAIIKAYGDAARRAHLAGFDGLEIHAAHGYLINQFMSPLVNKREDEYKDGIHFLRKVVQEIKKHWPKEKILQIRISGYEYDDFGLTPYDWAGILNQFKDDFDLVNVSSGGVIPKVLHDYPGYQVSYSAIIKEETGMKTIAGGLFDDIKLGEETLANLEADMIYYGRKLLKDPFFLLHDTDVPWPKQYLRAKPKKEQ